MSAQVEEPGPRKGGGVRPGAVAWTAAGFFGVLLAVAAIAALIVSAEGPSTAGRGAFVAGFEPGAGKPELEARRGVGSAVRPGEPAKSYAWVDRERGVARIPLARAMELLVERGWPAKEGGR